MIGEQLDLGLLDHLGRHIGEKLDTAAQNNDLALEVHVEVGSIDYLHVPRGWLPNDLLHVGHGVDVVFARSHFETELIVLKRHCALL